MYSAGVLRTWEVTTFLTLKNGMLSYLGKQCTPILGTKKMLQSVVKM